MDLLLAAALVLILDQLSKALVVRLEAEGRRVGIGPCVRIRCRINPGGPCRLLGDRALLLLWSTALLAAITLVAYDPVYQSGAARAGLGVALGGAAGNLTDRLWRTGVVDFVDVGFWPVFNLADAAIVIGLAVACSFAVLSI